MDPLIELEEFLQNINNKTDLYLKDREENKHNFNFFTALVSGKNSKEHIEKYHSNFIAYLLNPHSGHGFGIVFLQHFLNDSGIEHLHTSRLEIEREYQIGNGRFIDIAIKYGGDVPIFIENKVRSGELTDQLKDYFEFTKEKNNQLGIYLSLDGKLPNNYKGKDFNLKCWSYDKILSWIEKCKEEVRSHSHLDHIFRQYIEVVQSLLNLSDMDNLNEGLLKENKSVSHLLLKHHLMIDRLIRNQITEIKTRFLKDLKSSLTEIFNNNDNKINVFIEQPEPNIKGISVVLRMGDLIFTGNYEGSFGLGFQLYFDGEPKIYNGANGYGGSGNHLVVKGRSAHYGNDIDNTNAMLSDAYFDLGNDTSESWDVYLKENILWIETNLQMLK